MACEAKQAVGAASTEALRAAEALCESRDMRLTMQRRAVLEILLESPRPRGAYELLDALRAKQGRNPAPIAIYRALDFLKEVGLIHRLESLNAFVACLHRHEENERVVFLICEACRRVDEAVLPPLNQAIGELAKAHGFSARRQIVELAGTCRDCCHSNQLERAP